MTRKQLVANAADTASVMSTSQSLLSNSSDTTTVMATTTTTQTILNATETATVIPSANQVVTITIPKNKKSLTQYIKDWIKKKRSKVDWTFNDFIVDDEKETIVCKTCKLVA